MQNIAYFKSVNYPLVPIKTQMPAEITDAIYLASIGEKWEFYPQHTIAES